MKYLSDSENLYLIITILILCVIAGALLFIICVHT